METPPLEAFTTAHSIPSISAGVIIGMEVLRRSADGMNSENSEIPKSMPFSHHWDDRYGRKGLPAILNPPFVRLAFVLKPTP